MTGELTNEDIDKVFDYLAELIMQVPEKTNEIMEFSQRVKPLIQNQMTTADIYNEIAVENLELKEIKKRAESLLKQCDDERGEECQKLNVPSRYCECRYCQYGWILKEILKGNSTNQ